MRFLLIMFVQDLTASKILVASLESYQINSNLKKDQI